MIEPHCLIEGDTRPYLFQEGFARHLKWFHGRRGESAYALAPFDRHMKAASPTHRRGKRFLPLV
jgi:hypothetical protein